MENSDIRKQFKSKERISKHGEVFTDEKEVKSMCDLFEHECERVDSRFFEPACGNGNFLAEILSRKLNIVYKKFKKNKYDFERYSILAISSLYGVDLMNDNVNECKNRLYKIWEKMYKKIFKDNCDNETIKTVSFILSLNIVCGNALTLMKVDSDGNDTKEPIIFPEWSLISGAKFKRRDFRFDVLLMSKENPHKRKENTLFENELDKFLEIHPSTNEYLPKPINEYEPIHYKKIKDL